MADALSFDVPVGLFQNVEDLKATVARLTALVETLSQGAGAELDEAFANGSEDGEPLVEEAEPGNEYAPFILLGRSCCTRRRERWSRAGVQRRGVPTTDGTSGRRPTAALSHVPSRGQPLCGLTWRRSSVVRQTLAGGWCCHILDGWSPCRLQTK
ncbi:hypothetical protein [Streptomyces chartreusis]|uniref:hypothetical protein n=1 Tax=Streptomyces chartreusis TaxID=1969 RepID=UPI0036351582